MVYTAFHLGAYISIAVGILASSSFNIEAPVLRVSLLLLVVSGLAEGQIAFNSLEHNTWHSFQNAKFGPFNLPFMSFRFERWANIEHYTFWIALLLPVGLYVIEGPSAFKVHST